jgi:release factor glutamine methyltransferase
MIVSVCRTITQWLDAAKQELTPLVDQPMLEAEILLAHTLSISRAYLRARTEQTLNELEASQFAHLLQRRCHKEPIAYITGTREFWSLELGVNNETLIPRPETELLVELVLGLFPDPDKKKKVADLGTGSGAIALALSHERPQWQIYATDKSAAALQTARKNAQQLSLTNIIFRQGNWCEALSTSGLQASFDVIVSNPPYIAEVEWESYAAGLAFEPRSALTSGIDGLDDIRILCQSVKAYLKPGGYFIVEHGSLQAQAIQEMLFLSGYSEVVSFPDLAGLDRAIVCRYFPSL